jgi:hypothetical protein
VAFTGTNGLTTIHSCDQATDAVTSCVLSSGSGGSFVTGTGEYVEGSAAYAFDLDIETHTVTFTPSSSLNLTNQTVWIWLKFLTQDFLGTWANGAVKCRLNDGTNWSEWYLAGNDRDLAAGFNRLMFSVDSTPDAVSGTLSISAVTTLVFYFTGITKSKLPENVFVDFLQYGAATAGLKVTGGSSDDFDAVVTADDGVAAGMLKKINGVFFINGPIAFGDTSSGNLDFQDSNQLAASTDQYRTFTTANRGTAESLVGTNHFTLTVQGNSGGTINFQMGTAAGGRGTEGCHLKTGGNRRLRFIATDTNLDVLKIYACTFIDFLDLDFPPDGTGREVLDTKFVNCGLIEADTCTFTYCSVVSPDDQGLHLDSISHNLSYITFVNCTTGVLVSVAGTYPFSGMIFVNCTYDIETTVEATLVDSYQPTEDGDVDVYSGSIIRVAQQFTGTAGKLSRAIFSIRKQGTPTGDITAKLYANSGGAPTGAALATSNVVSIAGLTTSFADVDFEFEDEYTLVASTEYHISIEYGGGDSSNRLEVEYLTAGAGGETCNTYISSWSSQTYDCRFQTNRDGIVKLTLTNDSDPTTKLFSATVDGAIIMPISVTLTVTCKNQAGTGVLGVKVRIETSGGVLIVEGTTNSSGVFTQGYKYAGAQAVNVIARLKGFRFNEASDSIGAGGLSVPFTMIRDQAVNLP